MRIHLLIFVLIVFGVFSCKEKDSNELVAEAEETKEKPRISQKKIDFLLQKKFKKKPVYFEMETADSLKFPRIYLPEFYGYSTSTPEDYSDYSESVKEELGYFSWDGISVRNDELIAIHLEDTQRDYGSKNATVFLVPSNEELLSIKGIKKELLEDDKDLEIIYEDNKSIATRDWTGDYNLIYFEYNANKKAYVFYVTSFYNREQSDLSKQEIVYEKLNVARNLTNPNSEENGTEIQFNTWEDYYFYGSLGEIEKYELALKQVDKEMRVFLDQGKSVSLASQFSMLHATPEFDSLFNQIIMNLEASTEEFTKQQTSFLAFSYQNNHGNWQELTKDDWSFYAHTSKRQDKIIQLEKKIGKRSFVLKQEVYDSWDDEYQQEYIYFYRKPKGEQTFYISTKIADVEKATFYNTMLDYYMKHKTLKVDEL